MADLKLAVSRPNGIPDNYIALLPLDVRNMVNKYVFPFPCCGTWCACTCCYLKGTYHLVMDHRQMHPFEVKVFIDCWKQDVLIWIQPGYFDREDCEKSVHILPRKHLSKMNQLIRSCRKVVINQISSWKCIGVYELADLRVDIGEEIIIVTKEDQIVMEIPVQCWCVSQHILECIRSLLDQKDICVVM